MTKLFEGYVEVQYGQAYIELEGSFDGTMETAFAARKMAYAGHKSQQYYS